MQENRKMKTFGLTFSIACQGLLAKQCAVSEWVPSTQFSIEIEHTTCS